MQYVGLKPQQPHRAEANGIGPVRSPSGECAALDFWTAWGGDGGVPVFVEVQPGNQPDVVEAFEIFEGDRWNLVFK